MKLGDVAGEGLRVRHRRSTRSRRPNVIVPAPLTHTYGYIAAAEPSNVPRGTTKGPTTCGGCAERDSEPKLKVEKMPAYHPACYAELVRAWGSFG